MHNFPCSQSLQALPISPRLAKLHDSMPFDATNKKNSFADAMIEYHQHADKEAKKEHDEKLAIWKKTELKRYDFLVDLSLRLGRSLIRYFCVVA